MLDVRCIAHQIIELTSQSWLLEKTLCCSAGRAFAHDQFIDHTPTKAVTHALISTEGLALGESRK